MEGSPISWKSKKQVSVSLSSAEVEYQSMRRLVAELTWLTRLLSDLSVPPALPIPIRSDSQAAIHITRNPAYRTAICKFKRGGFKDILSEYDLLAPVLKAVIEKINLNPDEAGDIVVGTVLTPGSIRAMECRIAAFYASFPGSGADEHIELAMWLRALIAQAQQRNYQGRALPLS
ncbi:hypothetical protein FXO38_13169 [Capsicum annuum]|nr:hypothetical protein FXO38_13169 [Capsicum annuum]